MSFCKVKNCRYPDTHVTIGHKCGKCGAFGHGQMECGKEHLINSLYKFKDEILPVDIQCNIANCNSKLHTKESHAKESQCCKYCKKNGNHLKNCPQLGVPVVDNPPFWTLDPRKVTDKQHQLKEGLYLEFYGDMGSTWFARNNKNKIEFLFMHSDNWGQYGEDSSHVPPS